MDRQEKIKDLVRHVAKQDVNPSPEESLFESGILDSFGLPDLVAALESEFRIRVPDTDLLPANFASIRKIEAYLDTRGA